jgi:hypothetical protein
VCFQEKALEDARVEEARAQAQDVGLRSEKGKSDWLGRA